MGILKSSGILLYRCKPALEFLLVKPGGPFWKNKDAGAWTIPKGEFSEPETARQAALREFEEETGIALSGAFFELNPVQQKSGKWVFAFAQEHDVDIQNIQSNYFQIAWPPKSGRLQSFPEIEKAAWLGYAEACIKINSAQIPFLDAIKNQTEGKAL